LASDPTDNTHALTIKDPDWPAQTVILQLALRGLTLLLNVRGVTLDEWNSDAFKRLNLTSETLTWDPTTTLYEEQEGAMVDYSGRVVTTTRPLMVHIKSLVTDSLSSLTTDQADVTDDKNLYDVLASHVQILSIKARHWPRQGSRTRNLKHNRSQRRQRRCHGRVRVKRGREPHSQSSGGLPLLQLQSA
jgi:hypothetical protein